MRYDIGIFCFDSSETVVAHDAAFQVIKFALTCIERFECEMRGPLQKLEALVKVCLQPST